MACVALCMGLVTLWRNYLPWTQAVVVAPLIANAKRPWVKAAWTTVLVATTAVFVVQSGYLFKAYFEYQKTTNIRLIYEPEATFPAVTFCNLNPFKKSTMEHSPELTNLVTTYVYVLKVKQEQMKSATTAAGRTTMDGAEDHERKKRDAGASLSTTSSFTTPSATPKTAIFPTTVEPTTTTSLSPSATSNTTTSPPTSTLGTATAQLTSNTEPSTTTTGSSPTTASAETTVSGPTPLPCQKTEYPYNAPSSPRTYNVWNCLNGTAFIEFEACNATTQLRTPSYPIEDINGWKDDLATIFYTCYGGFCPNDSCATYVDGFDAIMAEMSCLRTAPGGLAWIG